MDVNGESESLPVALWGWENQEEPGGGGRCPRGGADGAFRTGKVSDQSTFPIL